MRACDKVHMMKLSPAFKEQIRNHNEPGFIVAVQAGLHPSQLSRYLNNEPVQRPWDIRFRLLAEAVHFLGELFQEEEKAGA